MTDYTAGDVVKVKNATNGIGIYQIVDYIENCAYYRVHVLDIMRDSLPVVNKDRGWHMSLKQFVRRANKNPSLYEGVKFLRYNLTTKAPQNVLRKLPITPEQVI